MNRTLSRVRSGFLALAVGLACGTAAHAGLIPTAPLEDVVSHSSHIAVGGWDGKTEELHVDTWLRGERDTDVVRIHGMPAFAALHIADLSRPIFVPKTEGAAKPRTKRLYLFLEDVDGELYMTGYRRYGDKFPAHSSLRIETDQETVLRLTQVINPGHPSPVAAEAGERKAFRALLEKLVRATPYTPRLGGRPPIAEAQRESFFTAVGGALDWYQGQRHEDLSGWSTGALRPADMAAAARRIAKWTDSAPVDQRVHGLDAMMQLCRIVQGGGPDSSAIEERIRVRLKAADPAMTRAWILRELRLGDYYVKRAALGRLAREHGPETYEDALRALEEYVERTASNEGAACWFALIELGHRDRAEAAAKRREARARADGPSPEQSNGENK